MRNRLFRNFLMAVVLVIGLFGSMFVGSDNITAVNAEAVSYDVEVHSGAKYVNASILTAQMDIFNDYKDTGDDDGSGKNYSVYEYTVDSTCVNTYQSLDLGLVFMCGHVDTDYEVEHGSTHTYTITKKDVTCGSRWGIVTYSLSEDTNFTPVTGTFTVGVYSYLDIDIDSSVLTNGETPVATVTGTQGMVEGSGYKVYTTDSVKITVPTYEGYKVSINGGKPNNVYTGSFATDTTINVVYSLDTDSVFTFNNTDTVDYTVAYTINGTINETEVDGTSIVPAPANTEVTISAVPADAVKYNITNLVVGGATGKLETISDDRLEYTFTTPATAGNYTVSADVVATNNAIKIVSDGLVDSIQDAMNLFANFGVSLKYTNENGVATTASGLDLFFGNGVEDIKYNTVVTLTATLDNEEKVENNDLQVIVVKDANGNEIACSGNAVADVQTLTFTAGVGQSYTFKVELIETTSIVSLSAETKEALATEGSGLVAVDLIVNGTTTTINSANVDTTVRVLKNTPVEVRYTLAEGYSLNVCDIAEVTETTSDVTNNSTFTTPATKKNIVVNVNARYTRNEFKLDARTMELVSKGNLEVYINDTVITDTMYIDRNTAVVVVAKMTTKTSDEINSFVITATDVTYTDSELTGSIAIDTEENTIFTISVVTNTTENSVEVGDTTIAQMDSGVITSITVNGNNYSNSTISVEKEETIVIVADILDNYKITSFEVTANGEVVAGTLVDNVFTFVGDKSTLYVVNIETVTTDNVIALDADTINALSDGSIMSIVINGTALTADNTTAIVAKDSEIIAVVVPSRKYLVDTMMLDGVSMVSENIEYPNYMITFDTAETTEYVIGVILVDATNTIACDASEVVVVTYDGMMYPINTTLPRDTEVVVTINPAYGEYIVSANIENATNVVANYVNGNLEITFTTGVNESYAVTFTTEAMFVAQDSDVEINMYDILLMQEGNEFYKGIVYNTLFDNVYSNNTNLTVNDVKFEYYAGTYTIPLINVPFDMYVPVEKVSAITPDEVRAYVAERYSETIANYLPDSMANVDIANYLPDSIANDIANELHRFGTLAVEKIQLVYAGDALLPYTTISATVKAVDLREVVELDVNEHITVTYGSYNDDQFIINEILKGKNGVMAGDTTVTDLNAQLALKSGIVGKSVGETEVTIYLHGNDYFYKGTEKVISVTIEKADVAVEMVKEVVNYELVQNGTINKDYIFDIVPDPEVVLENEEVDNVYFVMGLDIVDGEFIARVDLSNIMSADSDILGGLVDLDAALDKAIAAAIKLADPEGDGLTLAEFVNFITNLPNQAGQEGVELDTSYMEKITEVLTKISEVIDVRIFVVNDGTDITPVQHGAYLVGVVTTDKNYDMASDFGYLVITAEILDVKFVANDVENSLRKFEFDGTQKVMTAEAYEVDSQVASGNMKYYYVGVQTDATFYASNDAPVNAGTYTVLALFNNAEEGGLPSKVGLGIGAMVIMPSDDAEVVVNNAVHTYNGETFDIASMVSVNKADASLAYVTAGLYVDGDFSRDGFEALEGTVNIDFPARFDALLQEYMPEQFANGVNVNTFIGLLDEIKVGLENYGYTVEFVDSIIDVLGQMSNLVTITFNNLEDINPSDIGVFVVGAIVFDPNYLPKANLGVLVIQPDVTVSKMAWNYEDTNGIITVPALSKMDMTASVVSGIDAVVEYVYFGIGNNGELIKVTDVADITSGIWMQVAYSNTEVSADMNLVLPIARMFVVIPQTVNVEINDDNNCLLRQYNGSAHAVTATATYLNGKDANPEMLTITYIGVDTMGNRYYSNVAPTNAGIYTVIASYIERNDTTVSHAGFAFAELVITLADTEIESNDTVVCYDGEEHNIEFVAEDGFDYVLVIKNNGRVNVVLPAAWTIDFDADILAELAKYLPEDKIQEIMANYNISDIVVNEALPTEIGEYDVTVIAINPNYNVAIVENTLTIKDHNLVFHAEKAATCTEIGWNEYYTCEDCDYTTYEEIAELGHTVVIDNAVESTCTATGLTEGSHCSVCNEVLVEQEVTEKKDHTSSDWIETKAPTCITKGSAKQVCTVCNTELGTKELSLVDHTPVYHEGKPATCTVAGYTEYYTCSVTGCTYNTRVVIDALGHTEVVDQAVESTCTATGLTAGSHCSVCNEVLVEQQVTDKKDHTPSDWIETRASTCITKGSAKQVCTVCNTVLATKDLDLVEHTIVYHEGKPATCTVAGYTEYYTCSVPGCTYNTKEVIDALGHTEVVDAAVPATCTTKGLTEGSHCSVCNEVLVEQEETDMIAHVTESHNGQPATCTTAGWTAYVTCENCTYNTKEIIPALGHAEVIDVAVPATCTETGLTEGRHCSVCNEVLHEQQVVAMVDHTYGHWFVGAYATATTDGYYARTCSVCNHEDRQAIDAYGDREVANIEITTGTNGKVTVDADSISEAVKDIEETGKKEIVISTGNAQETLTNVEIAVSSLQQIIGADSALTIETTDIHATFDKDALSSIFASVGNEDNVDFDLRFIELENLNETQRESVSNKKVAAVLSLQVISGDTVISSFGNGSVLVAIPFELAEGRTAEDYKIMYVAEDGTIEEINTAYLGGNLVVELGHFSEYVIVDLTKDEVKMTTAMIVAISVIAALALCACVGTIVLVRKEKKR